jgi:hypothetical protein
MPMDLIRTFKRLHREEAATIACFRHFDPKRNDLPLDPWMHHAHSGIQPHFSLSAVSASYGSQYMLVLALPAREQVWSAMGRFM